MHDVGIRLGVVWFTVLISLKWYIRGQKIPNNVLNKGKLSKEI